MDAAKSCSATFTASGGTTYALTIAPAPTGGTVTGSGLTCGTGGAACAVTFAQRDAGDTDGGAGERVYVHELGRGVQRDQYDDERCRWMRRRRCSATFTASGGGPPTGPPYTLTITPPTGGRVAGRG